MDKLTSRKFILSLLSLLASTLLCWFGHIDDGVYATVITATVGAYMTANWAVAKDKTSVS